ncbi:MAG: hypothetical protein NPIRA05_12360 [Nitrospirales bacterium]|nr:MAG: hypothetical protein NPIRA05_12360 [Nitrospirales bacterium]
MNMKEWGSDHFSIRCLLALCCLLIFIPLEAKAFLITNGDFELGSLAGWRVFETPNGSLGGEGFPRCVDVDVTGDGRMSKSAVFKVGQHEYQAGRPSLAGGGIYTTVQLDKGRLVLTADIASSYFSPSDRRNLAGGLFELLVDGEVVASHDFGPIPTATTQYERLEGTVDISAGMHEVRIRIQRPFRSLSHDQAPQQYLDNIQINLFPH